MAGISNEEISKIRNAASIVDVISSYINLEKKGKNYFGVCPFHDDHNPSLSVSEEKGIFTCFVCHKTGNVFTFVQDYENVSFIEAVKIVANKVGIKFDAGIQTESKYQAHYDAMELAVKLYQNNLKSKDGKKAREYLEKRGLTEEVINEFEIGLAPNAPDTLTKLLKAKKIPDNILIETGLSAEGNILYDKFRNRITFPIHDRQGRAVGFSARIYDTTEGSKYINTQETKIFKKGEILFNFHRAKSEAKKVGKIIIVEGQMDAIRVYSSGIKYVVATMGTALTKEHIEMLKRLNATVILCFDNDSAGETATLSVGEELTNAGVDLKVLRLSMEKDPDEYILKYGVEKYQDAINNSINYFDFKLNILKRNKDLTKNSDISEYVKSIIKELNNSNDEILIDLEINKLVKDYGLDKNVLLNQIKKPEKVNIIRVEEKPKVKLSKYHKLVEALIFYMINDIKYIKLFEQELGSIPDDKYQSVIEDILAFYIKYNYINIADFVSYEATLDNYELVMQILENNSSVELIDNDFVGIIEKIKVWKNENKINQLKDELKETSDINKKLEIMDNIAKLKKRDV